MPFTPFHLGVGVLAKAVAGKRFSFAVFAGAQVLMDIEPGVKMLADIGGPLHGPSHTIAGALLLAIAVTFLAEAWKHYGPAEYVRRLGDLRFDTIVVSAVFGTLSHIALDAMMHVDMGLNRRMVEILGPADSAGTLPEMICLYSLLLAVPAFLVRRKIDQLIREKSIPRF